MTSIKIDLSGGVLEVSGEEAFVKEIYQDFKEQLSVPTAGANESLENAENKDLKTNPKRLPGKSKTPSRKESYDVAVLKLSSSDLEELKNLYNEKQPRSGFERNTFFVYFLEKTKQIKRITTSHIYACYKLLNLKTANKLRQNVFDTASKKDWIDTSNIEDIKITLVGENFVEHHLPSNVK